MTVKQQLQAALALLGPNGENWTNSSRELRGDKTCVFFALLDVCGSHDKQWDSSLGWHHKADIVLRKQLPAECFGSVVNFNDNHTFLEVKALFERAIAAADKEQLE